MQLLGFKIQSKFACAFRYKKSVESLLINYMCQSEKNKRWPMVQIETCKEFWGEKNVIKSEW